LILQQASQQDSDHDQRGTTIDFIKARCKSRPRMWLHSPKRLAGLTLLIRSLVLLAGPVWSIKFVVMSLTPVTGCAA